MPFVQRKLDKSINQTRDIFDKYVYKTDDLISEVGSAGYFAESRFTNNDDWVDSIIECECSDGYIFGTVQADGTLTVFFDSNSGGSSMPISPSGSGFQVASGSAWFDADVSIKADREVIARGSDFTDQSPVGTDNPLQLTFGDGTAPTDIPGGPSDPVEINTTTGAITINQTGNYHFRLSAQYGRSGAGGTAWLWLRVLVNGTQAGASVLAKVNNSNSDFPYQAELTASLPATAVVTVELWRGSEGSDDGGVISDTPILAGANANPSADVIVSRYRTVDI